MSVASSVNSLSSVGISYVSTPEDAIALANIVQLSVSDELSKYLKTELEAKSGLSDFIKNYSELKIQLNALLAQKITKVTIDSLKKSGTTTDALNKLFNADGIRLGSTLEESNSVLQDLQAEGINLSTTIEYPVLIEEKDSNGKSLSENIQWFKPGLVDLLKYFSSGEPSKKYEGATIYKLGSNDKNTYFTVFTGQKNMRVDEQSIKNSSVQLQDKYQSYIDLFNKSLEKINSATNKLNQTIESISKSSLEQQKLLSNLRFSKDNVSEQENSTRRIDRIKFLNKVEEKNQFNDNATINNSPDKNSIIQKNSSEKVEALSALSNWISSDRSMVQASNINNNDTNNLDGPKTTNEDISKINIENSNNKNSVTQKNFDLKKLV